MVMFESKAVSSDVSGLPPHSSNPLATASSSVIVSISRGRDSEFDQLPPQRAPEALAKCILAFQTPHKSNHDTAGRAFLRARLHLDSSSRAASARRLTSQRLLRTARRSRQR